VRVRVRVRVLVGLRATSAYELRGESEGEAPGKGEGRVRVRAGVAHLEDTCSSPRGAQAPRLGRVPHPRRHPRGVGQRSTVGAHDPWATIGRRSLC
jgi:hypothetical protein